MTLLHIKKVMIYKFFKKLFQNGQKNSQSAIILNETILETDKNPQNFTLIFSEDIYDSQITLKEMAQ